MGENIRSLRHAKGWSQEELGEQAGLSYKFIGEIERGAVNPSLDSLAKIANALTINLAKLFLDRGLIVLSPEEVAKVESSLSVLHDVLGTVKSKFS
ncbi:helix-turn-helix domain-containing protein [Geomonas sp. Red69]|nr:helix-turn-helix domain-containing protein [Geomonas diazotrophica]